MGKWVKYILGVFATVFLGAIGSGLWERYLSRFIDYLGELSVHFVGVLFKTYKDDIYKNASLGFHEDYSFQLIKILMIATPFFYLLLLKRHPEHNSRKRINLVTVQNFMNGSNGYKLMKYLTLSAAASCIFIVATMSFTNRVVTYSMRSIDIVKPYISLSEYDKLKSDFYQISDTDAYDNFNQKIIKIAKEHSLKLPEE